MNTISLAKKEDKEEILKLYKSVLFVPADWDEGYPNEDTIDFDLSRDSLFIMKNDDNEIIAAISIDEDEEVNALACWSRELYPSAELARLVVRSDMENRGIARKMMMYTFDVIKQRGMKGVHILVRPNHVRALASYEPLGYRRVGECHLFKKDYICLELGF